MGRQIQVREGIKTYNLSWNPINYLRREYNTCSVLAYEYKVNKLKHIESLFQTSRRALLYTKYIKYIQRNSEGCIGYLRGGNIQQNEVPGKQ